MNIQLIKPSHLDEDNKTAKYKKALLPPLALAIIDRLTPGRHRVKIVDDLVEDVDFSRSYDLVGITVMTAQADRAYRIADRFRKMGVKVILGGVHPTVLPHEAKEHADSVVIGEAEGLWEQVLADFEGNNYKEFYRDSTPPDLGKLIIPKWDNVNMKPYIKRLGSKLPTMPLFSTRGCLFNCKFCSANKVFGNTFRKKPISNFLKEIDASKARFFFFLDDGIASDIDYTRELFKALIPKKIVWTLQISTNILKSPDLIELAGQAGCNSLLFGIESLNKKNLNSVNKGFNHPEAYEELFSRVRKAGIIPCPTFIFGFDEDTPGQFELTMDFLKKNKMETALFGILTPFPGTALYEEFDEAGRILTKNWSRYDLAHLVFQPKNFTNDEFLTQFWKNYRSFLTLKNMAKRLFYITSRSRRPLTAFSESLLYMICNRSNVYAKNQAISDGVFRIKNASGL
ncbi:MAG: radical SAM protein [Candidatus Aminicenantes bacterium]|nr:radical SAM protein [Candidatus Aminicenantes bacterium]